MRPGAKTLLMLVRPMLSAAVLLGTAAAQLGLLVQMGRGALAKPVSGVGCGVYPGTTTITWHPRDRYHLIVLSWAKEVLDNSGELVSVTPVGTTIQVRMKDEKPPYSAATPEGANLWGMQVFDKSGNFIGVGGGVCE